MNPKTGFVIMRDDTLSNTRRRSLDLLYQPLLHPTAYALINLLWQLGEISTNPLFRRPVYDLLAYLNVDIKVLQMAIRRVEGAGLMRTFYKRDSDHPFYIFHLIQPVSARSFFNTDLLSVGLLEIVGRQRFINLSRELIPKSYPFKNVHDISRDFLEVYNVGSNHITNLPKLIQQIRSGISAKMSSSLKEDQDYINKAPDFNFKFLMDIIKHDSYADPKAVERHRHLILTEHILYGLDEYAMANYISQAASVVNNQVDFTKFKWLISKAFQGNSGIPTKTKFKDNDTNNGKQDSRTLKEKQALIRAADYYSPVQFLGNLKKTLSPHAVVTHQEEYILGQLLDNHAFRDNKGVINILTYYVLVEKRKPAIQSHYMQYVMAAWSQVGVNTPSDALTAIFNYNQNKIDQKKRRIKNIKKRHAQRYSYGKYHPVIKRKLPKWARSDYHVKLHPTSPKAQQKVKQQLKKLNHQSNHRKGGHK